MYNCLLLLAYYLLSVHNKQVYEQTLGDDKYTFVEDVRHPRSCTILIKVMLIQHFVCYISYTSIRFVTKYVVILKLYAVYICDTHTPTAQ
jgi:hypothetical protein